MKHRTWYSLHQLWKLHGNRRADGKSVKVVSENGTVVMLMGITKTELHNDERAYGYLLEFQGAPEHINDRLRDRKGVDVTKMRVFDKDKLHWRIWEKPKPVPHWRALYKTSTGHYALSERIFTDAEQAAGVFSRFVRLYDEVPPIMVVPVNLRWGGAAHNAEES